MIAETFLDLFDSYVSELRLPFGTDDMKAFMLDLPIQPEELDVIQRFLDAMVTKKHETAIRTLKKLSRIPQKSPSTFENFNMDRLCTEAKRQVNSLKTLTSGACRVI